MALKRGRGPKASSTVPYALEILKRALESSKINPPVEFMSHGAVAMVRIMDSQLDGIVRVGTSVYRDDYMLDAEVAQRCTVPTDELEAPPPPLLRSVLPGSLPATEADGVLAKCIAMKMNSDFLMTRLTSGSLSMARILSSNTFTTVGSGRLTRGGTTGRTSRRAPLASVREDAPVRLGSR